MKRHEDFIPHLDEIQQLLGGKVNRQELETELSQYLEEYRIPLKVAKQMLVKKYGGEVKTSMDQSVRMINELGSKESSVDLLGRFVTINQKEIVTDRGPPAPGTIV